MTLPASLPSAAGELTSIENVVALSPQQYDLGSLILMVSYGAHFAFIIYFLMMSFTLAPRYRIVPILSAIVMASAGLSLLREFSLWQEAYAFAGGNYQPLAEGSTFTNAFRYGNWTITVPILLTQLALAFNLPRPLLYTRAWRMGIPAVLMIWTGLYGQFGEVDNFAQLNLWGIISSLFFVWLIIEVRLTINAGVKTSPGLESWPRNLFWYFLATWGLYPIAYALPQLGFNGDVVVTRQLLFSIADISTKLVYGIILSRYVLRRSAAEGYAPSVEALSTEPLAQSVASQRGD